MDNKTDVVARLPIFAGLDQRSTEAVATLANIIELPAGSVLVTEGEAADTFYVIVTGTIRIERDGQFVRSLTDGGFLGEIALLERRERTATATCATDCRVLELRGHEFGRVMDRFPDVRARVEAAIARRSHT